MSRYPPGQSGSDYPMQNVNVQYNPNANPFDEDPPRQDAPLLLSSGYSSNTHSNSSNNVNVNRLFSPTPPTGAGYISPAPSTPYQQPLSVMPMPSPHLHQGAFVNTSRPHFDMSGRGSSVGFAPLPSSTSTGPFPPGTPDTRHYGPAPTAQRRRFHTTKKVKLTSGNLVLDCPVPSKLLKSLKHQDGEEFTHMRYTAATCDPNDFLAENYTLRPLIVDDHPRETELFIVMTMYNVGASFFLLRDYIAYCFRGCITYIFNFWTIPHLLAGGRSSIYSDHAWCDEKHSPLDHP